MVKKVVASLFSLINKKRIPSLKNRDDNKYTNDIEYKIADKMCSKGKIKFCVKELKLEKRLLISFGGLIY